MNKLKPCPKCGREPAPFRITFDLFDGEPTIRFQYGCHRCGVTGRICGGLAEAAEALNGRDAAANELVKTAVLMRKEAVHGPIKCK